MIGQRSVITDNLLLFIEKLPLYKRGLSHIINTFAQENNLIFEDVREMVYQALDNGSLRLTPNYSLEVKI